MKKMLPRWLIVVAIFQVVPLFVFPLETLGSIALWIWGIPAAIFALVGWGLVKGRIWAHTSTIFLQGFSIIGRLLSLLPGAVSVASEGAGVVNMAMIISAAVSIALSTAILFLVDQPTVTALLD